MDLLNKWISDHFIGSEPDIDSLIKEQKIQNKIESEALKKESYRELLTDILTRVASAKAFFEGNKEALSSERELAFGIERAEEAIREAHQIKKYEEQQD